MGHGGGNLIEQNGGISSVLMKIYPHHNWSNERFVKTAKKAVQRWLKICIRQLFPEEGNYLW